MRLRVCGGKDAASGHRHALLDLLTSLLPDLPAPPRDGRRKWDPVSVLAAGVLMVLDEARSLTVAFERVLELLDRERLGPKVGRTYQGLVKAARRIGPREAGKVRLAMQRAVRAVAGADWTVEGWVPLAADGSNFDCPRTAANVARLGRNGDARNGPPQQGVLALWHVGAQLPWASRVAPSRVPERTRLRRLLGQLPERTLLVMDAGFAGYGMLRHLHRRGIAFLVRGGGNVRLLERLGWRVRESRDTVYLWPAAHRDRAPLVLRRIVVCGKHGLMCLLTNVLNPSRLWRRAARRLYRMRWGVETMYRGLKQTMARRKMRAASPECARLELEATLLASALLGLMSAQALRSRRMRPSMRSVAAGLDAVRWAMRHRPDLRTLRRRLATPKDTRRRRGRRHNPDWPHKKNDPRPGMPRTRPATPKERRAAAAIAPD